MGHEPAIQRIHLVSMKSGPKDRNNQRILEWFPLAELVSMKSGLEDRNNRQVIGSPSPVVQWVSMKSGLEDRNNGYLEPTR